MSNPNRYSSYISPSSSSIPIDSSRLFNHSDFARKHLYYLLLSDTFQASFPFQLELLPFESYLVLFTLEGEGELTYQEQTYPLTPHSVIWIDCTATLKLKIAHSSSWKFSYSLFKGSHTDSYYAQYKQHNYVLCLTSPISHIPQILDELITLNKDTSNLSEFIISKLITDLITELMLNKAANFNQIKAFPKYLSELKDLFDTHYMDHYNLDELAHLYHVSKYKMIRDFSTYLHTSPINYLINKRLQAAKELLINTEKPVYEIAALVGIDNLNHFTNLFKKNVGVTPITYRKNYYPNNLNFLNK